MKKLFAIALAATMLAASALPTFAATELDGSPATNKSAGDYSIGVNGTYAEGSAAGEKISVDIKWDAMTFTYTHGGYYYDETEHTTKPNGVGTWSNDKKTITVTNHSNVGITATFEFTKENTLDVTGAFTQNDVAVPAGGVAIESADQAQYQTPVEGQYPAPNAKVDFAITGGEITESTKLGTITVGIAKTTANAGDIGE